MNSPDQPSASLIALVRQLADRLQASVSDPGALESVLAVAQQLEQCALETGQPLLAGAAICMQQRVQLLALDPGRGTEMDQLAQAWSTHGTGLVASQESAALEEAWTALQPYLAVSMPEEEPALGAAEGSVVVEAPVAEESVDAGAFLDSLDGGAAAGAEAGALPPLEMAAPASAAEPAPTADELASEIVSAAEESALAPAAAAAPAAAPVAPAPAAPEPVVAEEEEEIVPPEILEAFAQESREAFEAMEQSIMAWEKNDQPLEDLRNVFRLAHSVKGAANSVGLKLVGTVLHRLEDMLEIMVHEQRQVSVSALSALILSLIDTLRSALATGASATPAWKSTADDLVARVNAMRETVEDAPAMLDAPAAEAGIAAPAAEATSAPVVAETVAPLAAAEPPPVAAAPATPVAKAPRAEASAALAEARADRSTIRVETSHLDSLMNLVGDLLINRHRLNRKLQQVTSLRAELVRARERLLHVVGDFNTRYEFSQRREAGPQTPSDGFSELELDRYDDFNILSRSLVEIAADAEEIVTQIDGHFGSFSEEAVQFTTVTRQLQEEVARTRMVPVDQLIRRLQRAVRDASASEGKQVSFEVEGASNRIDKFISDQLFRPLLHVVRNAVSHGIESAAERVARGKPAAGKLVARSRTEAGRLVLEFSDDGGGLRRDAIVRVARAKGLLEAGANPDDAQLAELIFQPGFSTAETTTDVSGRGVGLDVVRQEVTNLGGTVTVHSRPGLGCTFVLTLPVTLAINQVMFVRAGGRQYALPINFVERVVSAPKNAFSFSGQSEMLCLEGQQALPVVRLHARLGLPADAQASTAIILTVAERRTALIVDRIQSKIDIVVKPLGPLLNRHPYFSGATLAGDGRVIFILDVPSLVAPSAANRQRAIARDLPAPAEPVVQEESRRILVVDDSLSIRRIATNYLVGAGFEVESAVDGSEALEKLRSGDFSLVVSDLEMPRVNGFELIAEMRRHADLQKIPVIILTSRDAAKHRERAHELGAAGYLIKPVSREQLTGAVSALLEGAEAAA